MANCGFKFWSTSIAPGTALSILPPDNTLLKITQVCLGNVTNRQDFMWTSKLCVKGKEDQKIALCHLSDQSPDKVVELCFPGGDPVTFLAESTVPINLIGFLNPLVAEESQQTDENVEVQEESKKMDTSPSDTSPSPPAAREQKSSGTDVSAVTKKSPRSPLSSSSSNSSSSSSNTSEDAKELLMNGVEHADTCQDVKMASADETPKEIDTSEKDEGNSHDDIGDSDKKVPSTQGHDEDDVAMEGVQSLNAKKKEKRKRKQLENEPDTPQTPSSPSKRKRKKKRSSQGQVTPTEKDKKKKSKNSSSNEFDVPEFVETPQKEKTSSKDKGTPKTPKSDSAPSTPKQSPRKGTKSPKSSSKKKKKQKIDIPVKGGVKCREVETGTGESLKNGRLVTVKYRGSADKEEFAAGTMSFKLGKSEVMPGWDHGLEGAKVGAKRKLIIPPRAVGTTNMKNVPKGKHLHFTLEVVDME